MNTQRLDMIMALKRKGLPATVIGPLLALSPSTVRRTLHLACKQGLVSGAELFVLSRQRPGGRAGRQWSPKCRRAEILGQLLGGTVESSK